MKGHQQPIGVRVGLRPDRLPPAPQGRDREAGRIVVLAHRHPAGVAPHVVDAVRDRLAQVRVREVVDVDALRPALRLPFPPAILELTDQLAG